MAEPKIVSLSDSMAQQQRLADVKLKHQRLAAFLEDQQLDVAVLGSRASFAWITGGGRNLLGGTETACAVAVATRSEVVILAEVAHADWLQSEQLEGLDFEVRPVPWSQPLTAAAELLTAGRRVGADLPWPEATNVCEPLARLRLDLTERDCERLRQAGRAVSHAVEATARTFEPGQSESEIAGQLVHRLIKRGLLPLELSVASGPRLARWSRPPATREAATGLCWISAVGELGGLCAAAGRVVGFAEPEETFRHDFEQATMLSASAIYHAQPGMPVGEVLTKLRRSYERRQRTEEFFRTPPGQVCGYLPCERALRMDDSYRLGDPIALIWRPTFGQAPTCDTVMIDANGFEVVTAMKRWPQVQIEVAGHRIDRPGILIR